MSSLEGVYCCHEYPSCRPQPTPSYHSLRDQIRKQEGRGWYPPGAWPLIGCEGWRVRNRTGPVSLAGAGAGERKNGAHRESSQNSLWGCSVSGGLLELYIQHVRIRDWVPETWTTTNHPLPRSYLSPFPGEPPAFLVLWASCVDRWYLLSTTDCFSQGTISTPSFYLIFLANSLPCHYPKLFTKVNDSTWVGAITDSFIVLRAIHTHIYIFHTPFNQK